ncbi:hypothetical protein CRE_21236 [Caenorhabditis remanei]|uniref:Brinker DNA-binding domain-containing protein n=1 Tax=Caenorhabditis remanei TaxID=31234 RepID=E3MF10_CAERE|nr:hypothetical protein CRE_21236 [Caenorhabditis remanei]
MSSDVRKPLDPSTPYSRTLKQYSIDEKLVIISHAKNHGNRAAGREFNVAESSIREWRKNENKLIHNKNNATAGLAVLASSQPTSATPGPIHHNNNNNHIKNINQNPQHYRPPTSGIFGMAPAENNRRTQEEMATLRLFQLAMMDFNLTHLSPLLQLQHQQRLLQAATSSSQAPPPPPPPEPTSTASSVAGTPSSISSSSTPPPSLSPNIPSGAGRRKPKCPQKIVEASE